MSKSTIEERIARIEGDAAKAAMNYAVDHLHNTIKRLGEQRDPSSIEDVVAAARAFIVVVERQEGYRA